jgi:predicted DNA-binding transcriptional regulator AlpA
MTAVVEALARRGLKRDEAARYVGISPRKFDELVGDGRMPRPIKIDGRLVWDVRKIDAAFDDLAEMSDNNAHIEGRNEWD